MGSLDNTSTSKSNLKVVFGGMSLGREGAFPARVHDLDSASSMLDVFQKHGHVEIDSARVYGGGSSEQYLGQLKYQDRGLIMGTKVSPHRHAHKKETLKASLRESLEALGVEKVDLWYLHQPDHKTPFAETLEAVDELYKEGQFKRFGLSNFKAWEVAQICELCDRHGWKKPDVYQGIYHALHRAVEPELFPCLRRYGISFYEFSPLAGGMLTDRYKLDTADSDVPQGSRYDPKIMGGKNFFRKQYWNKVTFEALDAIRPVANKFGISTAEAALRWSNHHSLMKPEHGDAIIVGSSSAEQLESNLDALDKGPLPEEVAKAFDDAWAIIQGVPLIYYQ